MDSVVDRIIETFWTFLYPARWLILVHCSIRLLEFLDSCCIESKNGHGTYFLSDRIYDDAYLLRAVDRNLIAFTLNSPCILHAELHPMVSQE